MHSLDNAVVKPQSEQHTAALHRRTRQWPSQTHTEAREQASFRNQVEVCSCGKRPRRKNHELFNRWLSDRTVSQNIILASPINADGTLGGAERHGANLGRGAKFAKLSGGALVAT